MASKVFHTLVDSLCCEVDCDPIFVSLRALLWCVYLSMSQVMPGQSLEVWARPTVCSEEPRCSGAAIGPGVILADFNGLEYGAEYMTLKRGDVVELRIYDEKQPGWAFGRHSDGCEGWFPAAFWEFQMFVPSPGVPGMWIVPLQTRPYNLECVVVNFVNVGMTYGRVVEKKTERLFSWCGVRNCVDHLVNMRNLRVTGVIWEQFAVGSQQGVPDDILRMCESVEYMPRFAEEIYGTRFRGADDEMTIKLAYRRNCWFLDNDNYRDWHEHICDLSVARWLRSNHQCLSMKYFFDSQTGSFDTLDGIVSTSWRATMQVGLADLLAPHATRAPL